ncbi:hypothetical protein DFH27DRAFT_556093 [Peziza echinospora]|nr:hypothetical protein DFH27DRAFT_556093 [Peziza echinospora]
MPSQQLTGKVAIITGSSKGIGKSIALRLASDGASVIINYTSDAIAAATIVSEIGEDRAFAIKADLGNSAEVKQLVAKTIERFGRLDWVVCNAAIMPMISLEEVTMEDYERTFAVNVRGPMFLAKEAAPHLAPLTGRIILLSTSLTKAQNLVPQHLLYLSTKGAVEQMARVLAKDLGRKGINVNCISPGPTATDMFFAGKSEELVARIASLMPAGRLGLPEEVAGVVRFLVGEDGSWVNGQNIAVNGGMAV